MKRFLFLPFIILFVCGSVFAQDRRPMPPDDDLNRRLHYLEDLLRQHEYRLNQLEDALYHRPPPPPPYAGISCLIVDSGYAKTFLGKGPTRLQAETAVRQECGHNVNPTFCNGNVRCSSGQSEPYVRGYYCVVRDSGYGKIFDAEGADPIEAEAKAKQACQASVNATFCGNVEAKCEAEH